jgi:hypothetical protein
MICYKNTKAEQSPAFIQNNLTMKRLINVSHLLLAIKVPIVVGH